MAHSNLTHWTLSLRVSEPGDKDKLPTETSYQMPEWLAPWLLAPGTYKTWFGRNAYSSVWVDLGTQTVVMNLEVV